MAAANEKVLSTRRRDVSCARASSTARPSRPCPLEPTPVRRSTLLGSNLLGGTLLVATLVGCRGESDSPKEPARSSTSAPPAPSVAAPEGPVTAERPLIPDSADCTVYHHGLVLDWSRPSPFSAPNFALSTPEEFAPVERGGTLFRPLDAARIERVFYWEETSTELYVDLLVHAGRAERLTVELDGRSLGVVKLTPGERQVVALPVRRATLERGVHRLALRAKKGRGGPPSADVAWVRLAATRPPRGDLPPSRQETFGEVTLGKERRAGIVLRAGTEVRCPVRLSEPNPRIDAEVGVWGDGAAVAALDWLGSDPGAPAPFERAIEVEEAGRFLPLSLPVPSAAEYRVARFRAVRLARSARLVFSDPVVRFDAPVAKDLPAAKNVVLVVLAGLGAKHTPTLSAAHGLPLLSQLRAESVYFPGYRVSATESARVLGSLLFGEHAPELVLDAPKGPKAPTLVERLRAVNAHSAFFTAVPTTFEHSGVGRGFLTVAEFSPKSDVAAIEPITRARQLLEREARDSEPNFVVLHLRGAHPPFDLSRERARDLPPAEYGGDLDPRRAGLQLESVRARTNAARRILPEEDWKRLESLSETALLDQSRALADLVALLKRIGVWDDTLFIVAGDVGAGEPPQIPFAEGAALSDSALRVPLLVKFPRALRGGADESAPVGPLDVSTTIALSLGLDGNSGLDLRAPDLRIRAESRPLYAHRRGRYEMRLPPYALLGRDGSVPMLCRLDIDPSCARDRTLDELAAHRALFRMTHERLSKVARRTGTSRPDLLDEETRSALQIWGIGDWSVMDP